MTCVCSVRRCDSPTAVTRADNFDGVRGPTKGLLAAGLAGLRNAYGDLGSVYEKAFNKKGLAALAFAERNCQPAVTEYMDDKAGVNGTWLGKFVKKSACEGSSTVLMRPEVDFLNLEKTKKVIEQETMPGRPIAPVYMYHCGEDGASLGHRLG